ncbi:hypothetical protein [Thermobrachium celere]|uniref:hypothetical protein n=1 Tax=Thermobrachium celere TaxID=53422 RepID=UPI001A6057F3|nr:hypothetical protein [Thermobrachium celere]GFR34732.1 hypothetical protein TCEA9_05440 [Thermobrachium celere]
MPKCIILDEPTSQLDPISADEVLNIVRKINRELMINVIVIEQRVSRWFDHIDRLVVMNDGKIEFSGKKEEAYLSNLNAIEDLIPSRLKLAKRIGIIEYPKDSRSIKSGLKNIEFKKITREEKKRKQYA